MNLPAISPSLRLGKFCPAIDCCLRLGFPLLLLSLLLFTGCARNEPRADLVVINAAEPETLDPAILTGQPDMRAANAIFEGLTRLDPRAVPVPGLASHWEISPDGRIYTFHLRTNLLWSTGEPITSADVVYSWIRALDPATASDYASQLYYLKNGEDFNAGKIDRNAVLSKFTVKKGNNQ